MLPCLPPGTDGWASAVPVLSSELTLLPDDLNIHFSAKPAATSLCPPELTPVRARALEEVLSPRGGGACPWRLLRRLNRFSSQTPGQQALNMSYAWNHFAVLRSGLSLSLNLIQTDH